MNVTGRMGLVGGTFDPIHYGHLDLADAARACLGLDAVTFIPAHDPPHRENPRASVFHRFALLALAIDGLPHCSASDAELTRQGPSFTIETLRRWHADGWAASQLFFIIGTDAFAEIATWREYPAVLDAANFAVLTRPGTTLEAALARTPELKPRVRLHGDRTAGSSGTSIFLVEARTRDVSSTQVRARIAAGDSIADLVPAPVARHIAVNHLYRPVDELHG
jgi:nicotinate-nucleotide adenylyltransferase